MPRIRNIKPRFWDSPDTAKADLAPRLLFMALWNWADDSGRGTANLKELEAFAFPNDDVTRLPRKPRRGSAGGSGISAAVWPSFGHILAEVQKCYGVTFYRVSSRNYFEIPSFKDHQSKNFKPDSGFPGPSEGEIWDLTSEFTDSTAPTTRSQCGGAAEIPQQGAEIPRLAAEHCPLDRDRDGDGDRDGDVVYDDRAPAHVDTAARPIKRQPSSSSKALVRQELGSAEYPRTMIDRLAVQVENLLREGQTDTRIREALREWDRRPKCDKPEFLPTVLADLVKKSRATSDLTPGEAKVIGWAELGKPTDQRKAIGQ